MRKEVSLKKEKMMKAVEKKNKKGLIEETSYYGDNGKPVLNEFGFAKKTNAYDANGNVIEERFYGVAGEPVLCKVSRCTRIARSYRVTDSGKVVEERYYGLSGKPVKDAYGTAGRMWIYDTHDCPLEDSCFGLSDEPVVHKMYGCAKTIRVFNANNRLIEERYYGVAGEPVTQKVHGFAKITWAYQGAKVEKLYHTSLRAKGQVVSSETLAKSARECKISK